ncbi:MAG: hypothetical protein PVJ69_11640 [Desulfobacteraceae bacterium]|jgi:hypothetical protein
MNTHTSEKELSRAPRKFPLLVLIFLALVLGFPLPNTTNSVLFGVAEARIGRPASPGSAAGVHRRHTRRTVRRHVAVGTRVHTLPAGCTNVVRGGVSYHHCGGVYYRPYYEGNKVVYVVEEP